MKALRRAFFLVLLATLCVSVASCADGSSRRSSEQVQTAPAATGQASDSGSVVQPRLTIQSGEGERLNLPWFVRGIVDKVNEDGTPADPARPPQ